MQKGGDADWRSESEADSLATIRVHPPHLSSEESMESDFLQFDFSNDLQMSRVYRRNQAFRKSGISLVTNSAYSLGWSFFSDVSMAEVSDISVINLAILEGDVFNPGRSSQTWSAQRNKEDPTDGDVNRQYTLPYRVAREPMKAGDSASNEWGYLPAASQTQLQSLLPNGSSTCPKKNPMEQDDESHPCDPCHFCKGCGEVCFTPTHTIPPLIFRT